MGSPFDSIGDIDMRIVCGVTLSMTSTTGWMLQELYLRSIMSKLHCHYTTSILLARGSRHTARTVLKS